MLRKIAFIYPWATHGGVEKVMLTRARLLNDIGTYQIDLLLLMIPVRRRRSPPHSRTVKCRCQNHQLRLFINAKLQPHFCIDFPAALTFCHTHKLKYFAECHTAYKENRAYLNKIPDSCSAILCPSAFFMKQLEPELHKSACPLLLLRNFVPWDHVSQEPHAIPSLPTWSRRPILFLGRMDKLKNLTELLDAFVILKERHAEKYMLVLCGPQSSEINTNAELEQKI
ncbi:hypothetical protein IC615_13350 [Serratia ureilytica]